MVDEHPTDSRLWGQLAQTCNNIAQLQHDAGELEEALCSYERARQLREKLVDNNPTWPDNQRDLGASCINIGNLYRDTDRQAEALRSYERACIILTKLVNANPLVPEYQNMLAATYSYMAGMQPMTAELTATLGLWQQALTHWERAVKLDDGRRRDQLRIQRAVILVHLGRHAEAVTEAVTKTGGRDGRADPRIDRSVGSCY